MFFSLPVFRVCDNLVGTERAKPLLTLMFHILIAVVTNLTLLSLS